jgi:O-antigen ligase
MEFNQSRHYRALLIGLSIFAFILPLSKSAGSAMMGLIYFYLFVMMARDKSFRSSVARNVNQPLTVPVGIYIFIALLDLFFTSQLSDGINIVKQIINLPLIYLMLSVSIDGEHGDPVRLKDAEQIFLSFLAGIFVLDLIALFTYLGFIGNARHVLPVHPMDMHHIWFGNLNAIGVYTAVFLLLFPHSRRQLPVSVLLWCLIGLAAISILLSTSRTAWLGMIFTFLVLLFFLIKNKKLFVVAGILVITACVAAYFFSDIIHQRIGKIWDDISLFSAGTTETSVGARFLMWKGALTMFLSHPFLGVGTGDYKMGLSELVASGALPPFVSHFNQPHNMYLFTLATNGLIGFFALLFIFYRIFRYAAGLIRLHQEVRLFGFLSMAATVHFMTAGLTESVLNVHVLLCTFAFIAGLCVRRL